MSLPVLVTIRGIPDGTNPSWDATTAWHWDDKHQYGRMWQLSGCIWGFEVYIKDDIEIEYDRWIGDRRWKNYQIKIEGMEFNPFRAVNVKEFIDEVWYRIELFEAFYDESC